MTTSDHSSRTNSSASPIGGAFLLGDTHPVYTPEDLGAEDRLAGDTATRFLRDRVLPATEQIEQGNHTLMHTLMKEAGELGLLGADIPAEYGGLGLSQPATALIAERLNPQQSFALTHEAHTVIATLPLLYFGSEHQKNKYLPGLASGECIGSFALSEAGSGSDALALQTRAEHKNDGTYLLNGEKMWITNSAFAGLFTVFARTDKGVTAFLVERDCKGVSFGREENKLGMHGTSTRRVILENAVVPSDNALEEGKGHYAAFCALNIGRFRLEAGAVGGLKYLLEQCAQYAVQRKTFGKSIGEYGLIRQKLAEMAAHTFALESMVYRIAGELENLLCQIPARSEQTSVLYHKAAEELAIECNMVKVFGSEAYSVCADEAIQIHGGYGYTEELPLARAWRDQRLLRIGEGANEIVRVAIVNLLLRRIAAERLALPKESDFSAGLEQNAASLLRGLGLDMLREAKKRIGAELPLHQEACACIADVLVSAYAQQSVFLRTGRMQEGNRRKRAVLLADVQAQSCVETALLCARRLSLILAGDAGEHRDITGVFHPWLAALTRFSGSPLEKTHSLATLCMEMGSYPLV